MMMFIVLVVVSVVVGCCEGLAYLAFRTPAISLVVMLFE